VAAADVSGDAVYPLNILISQIPRVRASRDSSPSNESLEGLLFFNHPDCQRAVSCVFHNSGHFFVVSPESFELVEFAGSKVQNFKSSKLRAKPGSFGRF
jgi:hypothetical protein